MANSSKNKGGLFGVILRLSLIPSISLGVILAITASIITTTQLYNQYIDEAGALARSYGTAIENLVTDLSLNLDAVANEASVVDESVSLDEKKATLAKLASATNFKDFSISYADGKTLNDTDISAREYFKNAMAQKSHYVSSPVLRMTDNSLTIMMGKYFSADGKDYVAYGGLDVDTFNNVISKVHFGEHGVCYLVDKDGMVIASSSDIIPVMTQLKGEHDAQYDAFTKSIDSMIAQESGHSFFVANGEPHLFSYLPIEGSEGWSIAVGAPSAPILGAIFLTIFISVVILLVVNGVNIIIVTKLSRNVCKPIIECADRLEKFANGDISSPAPVCTQKNETKIMADSLARMISTMREYIGDIQSVLTAISNGDLTVTTNAEYNGDFESIKSALELILASLNKFISSVGRSASEVNEGANQLSEGSQSLSQNAITQAAAVEEITSTVINIAEKTESNTQNVKKALELARHTDSQAQEGTQRMQEMLGAITEIEESANEIEHIIKVIDDIAFQTNILALNAAIEAARAGEAGKGFAVVADEVRNLAAKSSEAAGKTAELIRETVQLIEKGSSIAEETGDNFKQITLSVNESAELVAQITAATEKQNEAVTEIKGGVEQISAVVQQNNASAEKSASTSEELFSHAQMLNSLISKFKTE